MIRPEHLQEWLDSCVDSDIVHLNVKSLWGYAPADHLLYSNDIERSNTGRVATKWLRRYRHIERGGWHCSGIEPDNGNEMEWGCFKPDFPRCNEEGQPIKYEHPPKSATRAFFLRVPLRIWQKIAERYSVAMPEDIVVRETGEALGFWPWVLAHPGLPITITEGAKKAGALLSAGYIAIALPGINNGYRRSRDEHSEKPGNAVLIADLMLFASEGREIYICFDQDTKQKTAKAVDAAIAVTGSLFEQKSCLVRNVSWAKSTKGVDDLIAAFGAEAFDRAYREALWLDTWKAKSYSKLTYPIAQTVNVRYFGEIAIPDSAQFVCLKGAKGTGKTEVLAEMVQKAIANGQPVLVISHRVQLGEALCQRFGIPYITEVDSYELGKLLGYGLCIDSLRPKSQANFSASGWGNALVIIDEIEQVVWHLLNSSTCQKERVPILRELQELLSNIFWNEGRFVCADADLSDVSIDYIKKAAGVNVDPSIVVNEWKPGESEQWNVYNYIGNDPSGIVSELEKEIETGGKALVFCSAQKAKSRWGTRNLEEHFRQKFPEKQILRIDSESVADPSHLAYGAITHLNKILPDYDIVLCSPSIETGVSIDVRGHFTSVWGIAQGVQAETSVRQALARLREPVPRHLWAARYGLGKIGNGSTSVKSLLTSQHKLTRANIQQLQLSNLDALDLDFQPEALRTWAKMAVRVNLGMSGYRDAIIEGLKGEGHHIINMSVSGANRVKEELTATSGRTHAAEAEAITAAYDLTQEEFEERQNQKAKTPEQRHQERKYSLKQRYAVPVTPELVFKDDAGWYPQVRMHYFLTVGREFLPQRDRQRAREQFEQGHGAVFLPDFNRGQLSAAVAFVEQLGVLGMCDGRELTATDEAVLKLAEAAQANRWGVKAVLGIAISEKDTPIAIAQKLLGKAGLKLTCCRKEGARGAQVRIYKFVAPTDGRAEVFASWAFRDGLKSVVTPSVVTLGNKEDILPPLPTGGVTTKNATDRELELVDSLPLSPDGSEDIAPSRWGANLSAAEAAQPTASPAQNRALTVGDMVRWIVKCPLHLLGMNPFRIRQVEEGVAWLDWVETPVPLAHLAL